MFCSNCGQSIPSGTFCNHCGASSAAARRSAPMSVIVLVVIGTLIVGGVLAVGGLFLGLYFANRADQPSGARREEAEANVKAERQGIVAKTPQGRGEEESPPPVSYTPPTNANAPAAPPANYNSYDANRRLRENINANVAATLGRVIVDQTFAVAPGRFSYFQFSVREGATVVGSFRASGGRDDIQALLIPAFEMENFKNGHQFRLFYDSGWVTVGRIDVRLPAGDYYLVFSNVPSVITNKVVTAHVTVQE